MLQECGWDARVQTGNALGKRIRPVAPIPLLRLRVLADHIVEYRKRCPYRGARTELISQPDSRLKVIVVGIDQAPAGIAGCLGAEIWEIVHIFAKLPGKSSTAVLILARRKEIIAQPEVEGQFAAKAKT